MTDGYRYEIQRSMNGEAGYVSIDSIGSALQELSPDGFLRAHYDRPIGDRIFIGRVELPQEDIAGKSEEEIIKIIDETILQRHS